MDRTVIFKCLLCSRILLSKKGFEEHMHQVHKVQEEAGNEKPTATTTASSAGSKKNKELKGRRRKRQVSFTEEDEDQGKASSPPKPKLSGNEHKSKKKKKNKRLLSLDDDSSSNKSPCPASASKEKSEKKRKVEKDMPPPPPPPLAKLKKSRNKSSSVERESDDSESKSKKKKRFSEEETSAKKKTKESSKDDGGSGSPKKRRNPFHSDGEGRERFSTDDIEKCNMGKHETTKKKKKRYPLGSASEDENDDDYYQDNASANTTSDSSDEDFDDGASGICRISRRAKKSTPLRREGERKSIRLLRSSSVATELVGEDCDSDNASEVSVSASIVARVKRGRNRSLDMENAKASSSTKKEVEKSSKRQRSEYTEEKEDDEDKSSKNRKPSKKKRGRKQQPQHQDAGTSTATDHTSFFHSEVDYQLLEADAAIAIASASTSSSSKKSSDDEGTATIDAEYEVPLGKDEVHAALNALKYLTTVSVSESAKKLQLQPVLRLVREPTNEITISPAENGKVEILYTGKKEDFIEPSKSSSKSKSGNQYSEWRCETVERFERRKSQKKSKSPLPLEEESSFALSIMSLQVVNVHGLTDDIHSILDLLTGQKMTTIILDGYLMLTTDKLQKKLMISSSQKDNIVFLPSMFLPIFKRSHNPKDAQPNMMFFPTEDLRDKIVIAPILSCRHFYLAIFDFPEHSIHIYDSSWPFLPIEHRFFHVNNLLKILVSRNMPDPSVKEQCWKMYFVKDCAQQIDDHSCGCYVMYFAENHVMGHMEKSEEPLTAEDVKGIRQDMARKLLDTTNIGRQILDTICY